MNNTTNQSLPSKNLLIFVKETFSLNDQGAPYTPNNNQQLIVTKNGLFLDPASDYNLSGDKMNSGAYIYQVSITDYNNKLSLYNGEINLIR